VKVVAKEVVAKEAGVGAAEVKEAAAAMVRWRGAHVDRRGDAVVAERLADHRANGQVRHVVVVHDLSREQRVGA